METYSAIFAIMAVCAGVYGKMPEGDYYGIPLSPALGTFGVAGRIGDAQSPMHLTSLVGGEAATGSIVGTPFTVNTPTIRLLTRGWDGFSGDKNQNRYELIDAKTGKVLRVAKPPQSTLTPEWIEWNVKDLSGKKVRIRMIDGNAEGGYAWLALDQIDAGPSMRLNYNVAQKLEGWELEGDFVDTGAMLHGGIPYLGALTPLFKQNDVSEIELGFKAERIFLFGLTFLPDIGAPLWHYAPRYAPRFFIGDELGRVRINYADGISEEYPLVLGDNLWWGQRFHNSPEPFVSNPDKAAVLENSLHLYPAKPVARGFRMGVIQPREANMLSMEFIDRPEKLGMPTIEALTVLASDGAPPQGKLFEEVVPEDDVIAFVESSTMKPEGVEQADKLKRLNDLKNAIYTTEENFPKDVEIIKPEGYRGPDVEFEGDIYAKILSNIFYRNLLDMDIKAEEETGMFRESTKNAASFGGYQGFGTYKEGHAPYWNDAWSRGVGREVQEYLGFGFYEKAGKCVDYCFRQARLWESKKDELTMDGVPLPGHWCRNIANPVVGKHLGAFENDGHGMIMLTVHSFWRKMPRGERDQWLKERWDDVKMAAEWIQWQFDNPEVSGARDGVLRTDSEANYSIFTGIGWGYTIYADYPCMEGLLGFAEMADSIGRRAEASRWRALAAKMKKGMEDNYIERIGSQPPMWTREQAGWVYLSSHLAPLIFLPDRRGFKPEDDNPEWRELNRVTYQRKIDKWSGKAPMNNDSWWWYLPEENMFRNDPLLTFPELGNFTVAMGYGQGFLTQSALLLDEMKHVEEMLKFTAKGTYYADYDSYVVPEGVEFHPDRKSWFRTADLGNGFQQASIMKVIRLVIGVDDTDARKLALFPRIPRSWTGMRTDRFPAWVEAGRDGVKRVDLKIDYELGKNKARYALESDGMLPETLLRVGPFDEEIGPEPDVRLDGRKTKFKVTKSGDSYWVRVMIPQGEAIFCVEVN